jgi:hypothetical protein
MTDGGTDCASVGVCLRPPISDLRAGDGAAGENKKAFAAGRLRFYPIVDLN